MGDLDWRDVGVHAIAGAAMGGIAYLFGWPLLPANAAFWIGREVHQRFQKQQPMSHMVTSDQVFAEWALPTILAPSLYFILWSAA